MDTLTDARLTVIANNLKWEAPGDIPSLGEASNMAAELIQHRAARNADTWPMCDADIDRMERAAETIEALTADRDALRKRLDEVSGVTTYGVDGIANGCEPN